MYWQIVSFKSNIAQKLTMVSSNLRNRFNSRKIYTQACTLLSCLNYLYLFFCNLVLEGFYGF